MSWGRLIFGTGILGYDYYYGLFGNVLCWGLVWCGDRSIGLPCRLVDSLLYGPFYLLRGIFEQIFMSVPKCCSVGALVVWGPVECFLLLVG